MSSLLLLLLGGLCLNAIIAWSCALWSDFEFTAMEVKPIDGQWPREVGTG